MDQKILERAAEHYLIEHLGYDEGRFYYASLSGKRKEIEKEYSYSKRYRILKNLFVAGALAKCKSEDKDNYIYKMLPPFFITSNVRKQIELFLCELYEDIYDDKKSDFTQFIVCNDMSILMFLLKYIMKNGAMIVVDKEGLYKSLNEIFKDKINISVEKERKKISGVIDNRFEFEFMRLSGLKEELVGYVKKSENSESSKSI